MSVYYRENLKIESIGRSVTIPDDNIARLMYYLDCVDSCLVDFVPSKYIQWNNYNSLSGDEKALIVAMAAILSPDILIGKVFIPVESGNQLLNGRSNEFYSVTQGSQLISTYFDTVILIEGKSVNVTKLMVFTENWFDKYYINPIKAELWRLQTSNSNNNNNNNNYVTYTNTNTNTNQNTYDTNNYNNQKTLNNIQSSPYMNRPNWTPDDAFTNCQNCYKEFNLIRRRHHCRACGQLLCGSCTPHKRTLPTLAYNTPVRVCVNCKNKEFY